MLENNSLNYKEVFDTLKKIILERDFNEIINFETMLREHPVFIRGDEDFFSNELELIELCALYIFCIMLKEEEEDIFPFLREYVLKILLKTFKIVTKEYVKQQFDSFYSLENNTIEERYIYYIANRGFNSFNPDIGVEELEEFKSDSIKKLIHKIFMTNYSQFTSIMLQGLFLLHRYGKDTNIISDPSMQLLFDAILRRLVDALLSWEEHSNGNNDKSDACIFEFEAESINFV